MNWPYIFSCIQFANTLTLRCGSGVKLDYDEDDIDPANSIKEAWIALQNEHPSIASTAKADKMLYQAMDEASLKDWLEETLIIDTSGCTKEEKYLQLQGTRQAVLCFLPKTKELLFQATHEIVDGTGMLMLVNNLCEYLVNPWKSPPKHTSLRLSPALATAASIPLASTESWKKCETLVAEWSAKSVGELLTIGGVLPGPPTVEFRVQRVMLSTEETWNVKMAAKDQGFSVAHVTHAAMIIAAKIHGDHTAGNWVAGMPFNARNHCREPFNTKEYPITPYFMSLPCFVENPKDLTDASHQVKKIYQSFKAAGKDVLELLEPLLELMPKAGSMSRRVVPPALPIFVNMGLVSNVLKEDYGPLKVLDVWMATHQMSPAVDIFCTTFRGKMCLNASYNGGYHEENSVKSFLSIFKRVLLDSYRS